MVPDNFATTLPPHPPECNPAGNIREAFCKNRHSNQLYENHAAFGRACCDAWNAFTAAPEGIAPLTQ